MPLPRYFYDLSEPITLPGFEGQYRFTDYFNDPGGDKKELSVPDSIRKGQRDAAYHDWFRRFGKRPKRCVFQRVRVADVYHAHNSRHDWLREFRDAVITVFMNPDTHYSRFVRDHVQEYIVCPEDAYLIQCYLRHLKGQSYHPRRSFTWVSPHSQLMPYMRLPTETSPHLKHETTGGVMPDNL